MSANRDVGSAVLEAYSRILESRVSQVRDMAMDVLKAAKRKDCFPSSSELEQWQAQLADEAKFLRDAEGGGDVDEEASSAVGSQAPTGPDAAERLTAKRHLEGALRTVGELLGGVSHNLSAEEWEGKKAEHDRLVKEGHKANNAGSALGAMECFEGAAKAFPKVFPTLISALNMRLKQAGGSNVRVCACAYSALLRTPLAPNEKDACTKKLAECEAALAGTEQPEVVKDLLAGSGAVDDAASAYGRAAKEAQESLKALEERRALQSETARLRSP